LTEEQKITELLETEYIGRNLHYFEHLGSTNEFLKSMSQELPNGTVVVAGEQFDGKGRRGNKWVSSKGQAAEMSILLKDSRLLMPPVTLICGLAVARALNGLCDGGFSIKWPNDIVCGDKKVCGILCESKISKSNCSTVCGIGVNVSQDAEFFKQVNLPHGASLKMLKSEPPSNELVIASILNWFEEIYTTLERGGEREIVAFFGDYSALCITLGREIRAKTGDIEIQGFATAVNADGTLAVSCGEETVALSAGEVSVRGIMGYSY
jgi:BirA family biotin operon repressor/biotin-[acetyl-CoA-carboxylase] ligase